MMWLILVIVAVAIYFFLRKTPGVTERVQTIEHEDRIIEEPAKEQMYYETSGEEEDSDEIIAVIMTVISEFSRGESLQVISIRSADSYWTLTGRQDLMRGRR